jgi:cytochrome P450
VTAGQQDCGRAQDRGGEGDAGPADPRDRRGEAAHDEDGSGGMTDQEIRDEIFTIFLAGYESTASGVAWTWRLLAQHPAVAERLRAEVGQVLDGRPPSVDHLRALTYARNIVHEALRLYPAFPMYFRSSVEADQIGPYRLPAKANVVISPYAAHRDPRHWVDPHTFDPSRFDADRFDQRARRSYFPFGMGQRICIGEQMALTIAQLFVAVVAHKFDVRTPPGAVVEPRYAMTYQPKNGLPVLLTRRT